MRIIAASGAVIAHLVDIFAAGRIGLAAQKAAIAEQRHAERVGHFHPFIGIAVDGQIPVLHLFDIQSRDQREIACHHQPLDMVGIGMLARMVHGLLDAGHTGFSAPIEIGQRALGVEIIQPAISGHVQPVNPAHIFPPAQNLPDETFGGIQRHMIVAIGSFRLAADFERQQQARIEIARQQRVVQKGFAFDHRILIIAEARQNTGDKIIEFHKSLCAGHGEMERFKRAEMI